MVRINELLNTGDKEFLNHADQDGSTVMHAVATSGDLVLLELLHKHGANLNATNDNGQTPLHIAASMGHLSCLKFLTDNNHLSQYDKAQTNNGNDTPARLALDNNHIACLQYLLEANIDTKNIAEELNKLIAQKSELIRITMKCYPKYLQQSLNNLRIHLDKKTIPDANSRKDLIDKSKILGVLLETDNLLQNLDNAFKLAEPNTDFIKQFKGRSP